MDNQNKDSNDEIKELKGLIEKNIELSNEVLLYSKKINNFVIWQRVFGVLKILIIAIPLILGIIYLPPLLEDVVGSYKSLLGFEEKVNVNTIPDNFKQYLR